MFNNVGRTIKILAKVLFGVGIGLSVILWLSCLVIGIAEQSVGTVILGGVILVLGIIGSWINSVFIYGFGSLVESNETTAENTTPELKEDDSFGSFK